MPLRITIEVILHCQAGPLLQVRWVRLIRHVNHAFREVGSSKSFRAVSRYSLPRVDLEIGEAARSWAGNLESHCVIRNCDADRLGEMS